MFTDNLTFGIPYSTKETNFKSLVSGVDTIKARTLSNRVVAAVILQDLGVQHFGTRQGENGHMLCAIAGQTIGHGGTLLNCEF